MNVRLDMLGAGRLAVSEGRSAAGPRRVPAFTLVELMLVMAVLLIVMAVSIPTLSLFFHGRHLHSEVNRFLSLSRFAQSRAVSEGLPMTLWIDTRNQTYGLSAAAGYAELDTNAVEYAMHESLEVNFRPPVQEQASRVMNLNSRGETGAASPRLAVIRYRPDGFIDPASPDPIWFKRGEDQILWLIRHPNGRMYDIATNQPAALPR